MKLHQSGRCGRRRLKYYLRVSRNDVNVLEQQRSARALRPSVTEVVFAALRCFSFFKAPSHFVEVSFARLRRGPSRSEVLQALCCSSIVLAQ